MNNMYYDSSRQSAQCAVRSAHCTLRNVHCAVRSAHCALCNVYYEVNMAPTVSILSYVPLYVMHPSCFAGS